METRVDFPADGADTFAGPRGRHEEWHADGPVADERNNLPNISTKTTASTTALILAAFACAWLAQSSLRGVMAPTAGAHLDLDLAALAVSLLFWVVAIGLFCKAFPAAPPVLPGVLSLVRPRPGLWLLLLPPAVLLPLHAASQLGSGGLPPLAWTEWLLGLVLALLLAWKADANAGRRRARGLRQAQQWSVAEVAAVLGTMVLAAALRLPGLDSLPFGVWYDEGRMGLDAQMLLQAMREGRETPVYLPSYPGVLIFYLVAAAFAVGGPTIVAMRTVVAIAGVITVPVFYLFLRHIAGPRVALAGAFLLAVSRWHVNFSRITFDAIFIPLAMATVIYLLDRGWREGRWLPLAGGGVIMGLGMYAYYPLRGFPALVLLFFAYLLATNRRRWHSLLAGGALVIATFCLAAAPLGAYALVYPEQFGERIGQVLVFGEAGNAVEALEALSSNVAKHVLMFNAYGDWNGRHNLPGAPLLDAATGALFLLGLGYCLRYAWRPWPFLLLACLVGMLVPGVLSLSAETPHALRAFGSIFGALALAALPLGKVYEWAAAGAGAVPPKKALILVLAVLPALAAGYLNYDSYFVKQAGDFASWRDSSAAQTIVARLLANTQGQEADIYISPHFIGHPTIRFLSPDAPTGIALDRSNHVPVRAEKDKVYFFLSAEHLDEQAAFADLQRYYPDADFKAIGLEPQGPAVVLSAALTRDDLGSRQGAQATYFNGPTAAGEPVSEGRVVRLAIGPAMPGAPAAPFAVELRTTLRTPAYGPHTFSAEGPAPLKVYLDENLVLDTGRIREAKVTLARGNHTLRVVALVAPEAQPTALSWQRPGAGWEPLEGGYLYLPPVTANGLLGSYYEDDHRTGLAFTQIDPDLNLYFNVYFNLPPLRRPYSVEWIGKVYAPSTGTYTFATESQGAMQVEVDGKRLIDDLGGDEVREAPIALIQGYHDLRLRFADSGIHTPVRLYWTPPGGAREVVPSAYLFPPRGEYPTAPER